MNKLILLNDTKKEKKIDSITREKMRYKINEKTEEKCYNDFKNKFCSCLNEEIKDCSCNMNEVAEAIKHLFLLNNKQPIIDFINFLYDDCLSIETVINFDRECINKKNSFMIEAVDDYRTFQYKIGIQIYDSNNIAIYMKKKQENEDFKNVVNFQVKKTLYKKVCCDSEENLSISKEENNFKIIVLDSNVEVPDKFKFSSNEDDDISVEYNVDILKSWKYNFKKLVEDNIYLLAPLKIFDFKKRLAVLKRDGYSKEFIADEITRFFKEINASLYRIKDKGRIEDEDIMELNIIAIKLFNCFIKEKDFELFELPNIC